MRALLAAALLLLSAAPVALAQLPANNVCSGDNFAITHAAPDAVAAGQSASIALTVQNKGQVDAVVNVSANVATPGWRLTSADAQQQTILAGGKQSFAFTVESDTTTKSAATVNFAGNATCGPQAPGGLPVSCPNNACTVQLKADTVAIGIQAPGGLRIPGLDNLPFAPEYLIAGIVLVAVIVAIPLALRKRGAGPMRSAASLACPEPLKTVRAGRGASFPVEVRNATERAAKLALEVGPVPEGWSAFLPLPEIQLAPKETRGLWLMVRAPAEARSGDAAEVDITATDIEAPHRPSSVKVRAEVVPGTD